jgi:hypothetical protein
MAALIGAAAAQSLRYILLHIERTASPAFAPPLTIRMLTQFFERRMHRDSVAQYWSFNREVERRVCHAFD